MTPADEESRSIREDLEEFHRRFPGTYELGFDVFHIPKGLEGAPWIEEGPFPRQSLAEVREQLGGDEGTYTAADGRTYPLSLKPWADDDPETTYFVFMPIFVPDPARRDELRAFWADRVPRESLAHDRCRVKARGYWPDFEDRSPSPPSERRSDPTAG
jgi:hypothetical protein